MTRRPATSNHQEDTQMTITAGTTIETPRIGRYQLDIGRSTVSFRTRHLFGLGRVRGTLAILGGTLDVADPLGDSRARVEFDAASFFTGNGQRDAAVRSARYLDADRHQAIRFTAERVEGTTLHGMLVVRDVAQPVELAVERCDVGQGQRRSFAIRGSARIDRFAFGLTAQRGMAGRHLDVTVEIVWVAA
jgi:polyisoprenoid-binding protein YceI